MADTRTTGRGFVGVLSRLGRSLKDAILNCTSQAYVSRLAGGDRYWDDVVEAQQFYHASRDPGPEEYYRQKEPSPTPPAGSSGDRL